MSDSEVLSLILRAKDETGNVLSKASKEAEGLTSKLKGVGKGMVLGAGMAGFNLLTDAVGMAVGKLGEAAAAYREDQAGQALLAQALKNNLVNYAGGAAAAEAFAGAQGRLGFADDDVRVSLGQLVGVTHDLAAAQDLTSLAMDLARAKGIDLATATDIVTKAHEGNGKALKALGVDIGTAKTAAEMLDAIQRNAAGSAETWAQTNEGKLAVSNVKVGEAMEKVGAIVDKVSQVVIPLLADAFTTIVDVVTKVWDAIQPGIDTVMPALQTVFEIVGKAIGVVWDGIRAAVDSVMTQINNVVGGVRGAIEAVQKLVNYVKENLGPLMFVGNLLTGNRQGALDILAPPKAAGGPVYAGRPYLVGERGPELFVPGASGGIVPNGGSGGGAVNVNVTVQGAAIFDPYGQAAQQIAAALLPGLQREVRRQGVGF